MTLDYPIQFLSFAIGLALLAGTFRSIKQNLIRQPAVRSRPIAIELFETIEWLFWTLALIALVVAAPHPVTLLLVALFVSSIATAGRLRYREEAVSLNRWVRMASERASVDEEFSLPILVESLADGCRSRLSRQGKSFVARLNRGQSIVDAARRSKLPLDADTLASIAVPNEDGPTHLPANSQLPATGFRTGTSHSRFSIVDDRESSKSDSLVWQQLTYVIVTLLFAWLLGWLIRSNLVPTLEKMFDEFVLEISFGRPALDWVAQVADIFMLVMAFWFLMAIVIRRMPLWMVRWVPWFGRRAIDGGRCEVLASLGCGIRAKQPASQVFEFATSATRVGWIRRRCKFARQLIENGTTLPIAMQRAGLVTAREKAWLTNAENNGSLASAIEQLISNIRRRQSLLWRIRMAWLVPLVTVLVGGFVLAHTMYVFNFLFAFIRGLS